MASKLTQTFEPILSMPRMNNIVRNLLQGGMEKEKEMVLKSLGSGYRSVLDFGCGTGEFSEVFPKSAYHGVDVDQKSIEWAKASHEGYSFSRIGSASGVKGRYERIMLVSTVHHLSPRTLRFSLEEFRRRLLASNGRLVIIDPVHPKEQKKFLGAWLFAHDRGSFQRTRGRATSEISKEFDIISYGNFQEKLLTFYVIIARPKKR